MQAAEGACRVGSCGAKGEAPVLARSNSTGHPHIRTPNLWPQLPGHVGGFLFTLRMRQAKAMAKDKTDFPPVPESLLRWLDNSFPDTVPEGEVSQRELGVLQGQQEVIRRLRDIYSKQDGPDVFHRR